MCPLPFAVSMIFLTWQVHAQQGFNIGLELGMPLGDFGELSSVGLGASGFYGHQTNEKLTIVGGFGFTKWFLKDDLEEVLNLSSFPVQVGVKYHLTEKAYLQGLLGLHIFLSSAEIFDVKERETETDFGFGVGGGFKLTDNLDLSGRFQFIDDANFFAIRFGFAFGQKQPTHSPQTIIPKHQCSAFPILRCISLLNRINKKYEISHYTFLITM